jgi:hypothetical protein
VPSYDNAQWAYESVEKDGSGGFEESDLFMCTGRESEYGHKFGVPILISQIEAAVRRVSHPRGCLKFAHQFRYSKPVP